MKFDLDAIEKATRHTIDVKVGENEKGEPVGFKVLGPGSEEYAAADREIQILNIKEAAVRRSAVDLTTDDGAALVADGAERRDRLKLERCVVGWFGFTQADKPAEFTKDNLLRVLKARPTWARMIANAIEDEAAFTQG
jgi:hypothetical protein